MTLRDQLSLNDFSTDEPKVVMAVAEVRKLCAAYLTVGESPGIVGEAIEVSKMCGGSSNLMLLVKFLRGTKIRVAATIYGTFNEQERHLDTVLLKIYSVAPSLEEQISVAVLSERGFGPTVYGLFPEGRLEEYIPSRSPNRSEITQRSIGASIARTFARLHQLDIPIKKSPELLQGQVSRYLDVLKERNMDALTIMLSNSESIVMSVDRLCNEAALIRQYILYCKSPVVFCHNDLNHANILLLSKEDTIRTDDLMFIDYEFSGYNYRGFDLADHLSEYMFNLHVDTYPFFQFITDAFPMAEHQEFFCRTYLEELTGCVPEEADARSLSEEVDAFHPIIHFFWAVWSLYRHFVSFDPKFSHKDHACQRLSQYFRFKDKLLRVLKIEDDSICTTLP